MDKIGYRNVEITGGFWRARQELNSRVTINAVYDRFKETGRIDATACRWKEGDAQKPHVFWDSDVVKWMEGAAYILAKENRPELEARVEEIIGNFEKNQWEDGYVNSCFTVVNPESRFTDRNLHELYCCGHMIEAAVAYYEATGKDRFLKLVCRYVDLVYRIFLVEKSAAFATPGHEEIELALFRLYGCTHNEKHRELAEFFVNERGNSPKDRPVTTNTNSLFQQDVPARGQKTAVGHAVRALYFYCAMADMARETGDSELLGACRALFEDIVNHKMYITGGVGSTRIGEAFTVDYDLPNETAYNETCAAIALVMFCGRMLKNNLDSCYSDTVERALYNGFLSGLSLDGESFFYENPLEINPGRHRRIVATLNKEELPITQRVKVFSCSCCPPNINRFLPLLGEYIYGAEGDTLAVHQFAESRAEYNGMTVEQHTCYPNDGNVVIRTERVGRLKIRIPGWCRRVSISAEYRVENGYAVIECPPERVEVAFDMKPVLVQADPAVTADGGKAALCYGPLVYCAEGADNGNLPLSALCFSRELQAETTCCEEYGAPVITVNGTATAANGSLYSVAPMREEKLRIRMIPYFAFANRGEDSMRVWLNFR